MAKGSGSSRKDKDKAVQIASIARSHGNELQGLAERVALKHNADLTPINYKSIESIRRKGNSQGYDSVRDAVRTTIISERNNLSYIVRELRASGVDVQKQDIKSTGYTGFNGKIKFKDGSYGEIQANTPKMIYAKEKPEIAKQIIGEERWNKIAKETGLEGGLGHQLYEKIRVTDPTSDYCSELKKISRNYYSRFKD